MALVPVYEGEDPNAKLQLAPGAVALSPEKQQLIGARMETVAKTSGSRVIRTTGRVEADDNRVYRLMAVTEGRVQSLGNNPVGTIVKKDEVLATFYSREFRNAEQAYLGSLTSVERLRNTGRDPEDATRGGDANLRINEEQLRALGMGEPQIKELARTKQITRDIEVTSPVDGVVLSRSISREERFDGHVELYRIADLSKIWILADLRGGDAGLLQPGARVQVAVPQLSKTLSATVSNAPPVFDPVSRTLKLRLEADNPGLLLRPDMFVDVEFNSKAPAGISIPAEAVLDSGLRKIVYVETSAGVFEPRTVEVGAAFGNRVAVKKGLAEGDRVVTAGNFMIDSESRMRAPVPQSAMAPADSPATAVAMSADGPVIGPVIDPACGMPLSPHDAKTSQYSATYHGHKFVFCSEKCQKKFADDPEKFAGEKAQSSAAAQAGIGAP
jgi:RND family efflux transporter MFP subunit